jgi:hypothetical protein
MAKATGMQMTLAKNKQVITTTPTTVPLKIINARCQAIVEYLVTIPMSFKAGLSTAVANYCKRGAKRRENLSLIGRTNWHMRSFRSVVFSCFRVLLKLHMTELQMTARALLRIGPPAH